MTLSQTKRPSKRLPYLPLEQRPVEVVEGDIPVDLADVNFRRYVLRGQKKLTDSCVQGQEKREETASSAGGHMRRGKGGGETDSSASGHMRQARGGREETAAVRAIKSRDSPLRVQNNVRLTLWGFFRVVVRVQD